MINYDALFKISYGLYVVTSGDKDHGNGFISNSVMQVTSEPPKFVLCCNKDNYTADFILRCKAFSVSILHSEVAPEMFGRFGFRSGRDFNKMEGLKLKYGETTGVPIVLNDTLAFMEFQLEEVVNVGTHYLFIALLVNAEMLDPSHEPITYDLYRKVRKGVAPKNAPTYVDKTKIQQTAITSTLVDKVTNGSGKTNTGLKRYQCTACDHIYDDAVEPIRFADLPDDWECPNCGSGKEFFMEIK